MVLLKDTFTPLEAMSIIWDTKVILSENVLVLLQVVVVPLDDLMVFK